MIVAATAALGAAALMPAACKKSDTEEPQAKAPSEPPQVEPGWEPDQPWAWKHIVIHHSASLRDSYKTIDNYHRDSKKWDGCGYHFVIGNGSLSPDGAVEVGARWIAQKQGAHAGAKNTDYNRNGVGICLVGNFSHAGPSAAQFESTVRLVRYLAARFEIPPADIIGHSQIRDTDCPGKHFPWAELRARLQSGPAPSSLAQAR